MESCCVKGILLSVTLFNILGCPVCLYFIFWDMDLNHIPQNWANVLTEISLGFGVLYYLYVMTWLSVACNPLSQNVLKKKRILLLVPILMCAWLALLQSKPKVYVVLCCIAIIVAVILDCVHPLCEEERVLPSAVRYDDDDENDPLIAIRTNEITRTDVVTSE